MLGPRRGPPEAESEEPARRRGGLPAGDAPAKEEEAPAEDEAPAEEETSAGDADEGAAAESDAGPAADTGEADDEGMDWKTRRPPRALAPVRPRPDPSAARRSAPPSAMSAAPPPPQGAAAPTARPRSPASARRGSGDRHSAARAPPDRGQDPPGHRGLRQGRQIDHRPDRHGPPPPGLREDRAPLEHAPRSRRAQRGKGGRPGRVIETRPLSKTKRWRLVEILEKAK